MSEEILNHAIMLIHNGDKKSAEIILSQLILQEPDNETALLWLATCTSDLEKRKSILYEANRVNPANLDTQRALETLNTISENAGPIYQQAETKILPQQQVVIQPAQSFSFTHSPTLVCPRCQKDDMISIVSAIVSAGTTTSVFKGHEIGIAGARTNTGVKGLGVGISTSVGTGVSATNLSVILCPPEDPKVRIRLRNIIFMALGLSMTVIGYSSFMNVQGKPASMNPGFICLFPLMFIGIPMLGISSIMGLMNLIAHIKGNNANPAWEKAMEKWNRIYFCHRDGIVFDPMDGRSVPVENMMNFLYN